MRWRPRRHRCPPGIRLVITVDGAELVNADSESLAYAAKYGGDGGPLDLLDPEGFGLIDVSPGRPGRIRVLASYEGTQR